MSLEIETKRKHGAVTFRWNSCFFHSKRIASDRSNKTNKVNLKFKLKLNKKTSNLSVNSIDNQKMAEVKKFTYAQVKEHNNEKDVWMVIDDKVYDVTMFLKEVRFFAEFNQSKCTHLFFSVFEQISILAERKYWLKLREKMVILRIFSICCRFYLPKSE